MIGRLTFLAVLLAASTAQADPCKAVPDRGAAPANLARGSTFSGPVVHVGDGDGLCVATGPTPVQWVEVRLADFYAPELSAPGGAAAKATLSRLVSGRRLSCRADGQSYDRIVALCRRDGVPVGELMRQAGVAEGGRGR
jgi:micrococcal nuclease